VICGVVHVSRYEWNDGYVDGTWNNGGVVDLTFPWLVVGEVRLVEAVVYVALVPFESSDEMEVEC
jgi:hypothetical protein